ncbi:hypothetical protein GGG16DRAFT_54908 [Schizophyllum commune]
MPATQMLFKPVKVGPLQLQHRVVMAPMTRFRASAAHVPLPNVKEYYAQRASTAGTLLVTEGTFIAQQAGGYPHVPGIWNDEQIAAWKEVTDAVHAKGSFIFSQLWALGRGAALAQLKSEDPSFKLVAPSAIPLTGTEDMPHALTVPEIKEYIKLYGDAARKAVHQAGFDGVEIHSATGYLVDQFLQDNTNQRTDEYGGSIENRARFALELLDEVVAAVGADRVAFRVSPWSTFQEMRMKDPIPQFSYLAEQIKKRYPTFAYLSVVEPRVVATDTRPDEEIAPEEQNDFLRKIWAPLPYVSAGAYTRELALKSAEEKGELVAVGRYFISNPDLVRKWKEDLTLTPYDRDTFYLQGDASPKGYTDYPFAEGSRSSSPKQRWHKRLGSAFRRLSGQ